MSDVVIRVEQVSKSYQYGTISHGTLYKDFQSWWARLRGREDPNAKIVERHRAGKSGERFWALHEISFDVCQGQIVGIIGKNGAGKSTLLKILSEITTPTSGRIKLKGRVGSLLEVGTGFHPELTGRENVFLNGAILGMNKAEIRKKFDEIVAFAEIEEFIDTPVKRYSSGMHVRLAFAIAAHLEPEILLVDEVLAVGDVQFQRRCLGKMEEVSTQEGRTVLFVSHNMSTIQALCQRALLIENGRIAAEGHSEAVVRQYLDSLQSTTGALEHVRSSDGTFQIERVVLKDDNGQVSTVFMAGMSLTIDIVYAAQRPIFRPYLWIGVESQFGSLFAANMLLDGIRPERLEGHGQIRCIFHHLPLLPQQNYIVRMGMREADGRTHLIHATEVAHFTVTGAAEDIGLTGEFAESLMGTATPVLIPYTWEFSDGRSVSFQPFTQEPPLDKS
jgi:lipopolysaccharide transport system ATP-binding protein